jgi:hypothetical protein
LLKGSGYRYIDDVLSINNSRFAEYLPLIYPPELEVKETTHSASSASFFSAETMINNSYPFVCRRPVETASLQRRQNVIDEELQHTDHWFMGVALSLSGPCC